MGFGYQFLLLLQQELKDQCPSLQEKEAIRWVITVPAIWKQPAKQFMREAAYKVRCLVLVPFLALWGFPRISRIIVARDLLGPIFPVPHSWARAGVSLQCPISSNLSGYF